MNNRGYGFATLHTVAEARSLLDPHISKISHTTQISVDQALHRHLAEDILAPVDRPSSRRAAMDGYAILAEDTYGASESHPVQLDVLGELGLDQSSDLVLRSGKAVRVSTGVRLPDSVTGVIRFEDTEDLGDRVEIYTSVVVGKNIAEVGEDVQKGTLVFHKDTLIQPWDIALLSSLNITKIQVYNKPQVGILSTGDELISFHSDPVNGQINDANLPAITSWLHYQGCDVVYSKQVGDDPEVIKTNIKAMLTKVDLVITTGGTAMGSRDFLAGVIGEIGTLLVHGIAIRPGKPVALGVLEQRVPIISLPGYPLAALLNYHLFVSYILEKWTQRRGLLSVKTTVTLKDKIASKVGSRDFVRLKADEDGAALIRISGAGILSSLTNADYLLEIPEDVEGYNAGAKVEVFTLRFL